MQPVLQSNSDTHYIFRDYVCSLRYPARNVHAPYYVSRPILQYLSTLSHESYAFRKNITENAF
jgi:hypothetical protein